jgi:hypothetical protein
MAQDKKRGFFSSLFRTKHRSEEEEAADLETRRRLEARIQQILADRTDVPNPLIEKDETALMVLPEEIEPQVDLLPITASVLSKPKAPVAAPFLVEIGRPYAANDRW